MPTSLYRRSLAIFLLLAIVTMLLSGCGGGSGPSATSEAAKEASAQFQDPQGPNGEEAVATFGTEAGEDERDEASTVLAVNLRARQSGNFAKQCATLGKRGLESVLDDAKSAGAKGVRSCTAALKQLAEPLSASKAARKDTLSGSIAAFRMKGAEAYALYHGSDGKDYAMPMEREDGSWKVGAIVTRELPTRDPITKPRHKRGEEL